MIKVSKIAHEERIVSTSVYSATVARDGCLTQLRVAGEDFLAPGVGISRGGYLVQQGEVLRLEQIEQPQANVLVASSDMASVRYEFHSDEIIWTLKNQTKEPMAIFLILAPEIAAMADADGRMQKVVTTGNWERTTWFRGSARLEIKAIGRQWGPWTYQHQAWESWLEPGQERRIQFKAGKPTAEETESIDRLFAPAPSEDLKILSPRDWQVFQRTTLKEGPIVLSGTTRPEADRVEYRISGNSIDVPLPDDWRQASFSQNTGTFCVGMSFPAGGWYNLEIRAFQGTKALAEKTVEHFGVGEVFLGAGQSNATNCGQFPIRQHSGRVASFSGAHWQPADDPQPGVADGSLGGSFWPAFGDALAARFSVPIGVASTGFGGTSVDQWQPEGELFRWMMRRVWQLGPAGFRGLLWHQGESDVEKTAEEYYRKLKRVILESKSQAGWEFPWFVAQASYHDPDHPSFPAPRKAQKRLWDERVALRGPDTDTLVGEHRDFDGLGIHFSPKGLKTHGEMWAERVGEYLEQVL